MKKITQVCGLALISLLGFTGNASAQITITNADMPTAGLTVITAVDTPSVYTPGPASATTQYWNFSGLKKARTMTVAFMNPSSTKYASVFSTATLADSTYHGSGNNFFVVNSTEFAVEGSEEIVNYSGFNFQVELNLKPMFVQSTLPATYGTKCNGVSRGSETLGQSIVIYDSEKVSTNITYFDTVDAFGTMKMPNGTIYNVLRQNHHEVDVDTIQLRSSISGTWSIPSGGITTTTTHEYNWYTNGVGYILAQMNVNPTTGAVQNVIWDTNAPTGINEVSHFSKVNVFPNPCTSQITFLATSNDVQYAYIYDLTGRQLDKVEMKNAMSVVNTNSYSSGMYLFTIADKDGNAIDQGKFIVK